MFTFVVFYFFIFPVSLFIASVIRISLLSFIYLILFFCWAVFKPVKKHEVQKSTICYLKIASTFPVLFAALQTCFHVTLNVSSSVNEWLVTCEGWEPELRMIGFERLDNLNLFNKIRIFLPEIIVFVTAVTTKIYRFRNDMRILWPIQKHFPPEDLPARLIGMKAYLNSSCNPGEIWTGEKLLPEIPAEIR
ncbi:Piezo-type mechanosensitive ion channel component [Trichinella spiralis]|uniref:Piezo-type mechanosensitive ion channel component n=1 Tax=Trichinella spiralis TaxID=6334 RepID=A0ABR3KMK7_TRISP